MWRRIHQAILVGFLVWAPLSFAFTGVNPSVAAGVDFPKSPSLFDPSRLSLTNAMVFSYHVGGGDSARGALFSTLGYTVRPNLTVRATLSKEFTFLGPGPSDAGISLSGFEMNWMPTDNLFVKLEFSSTPIRQYGSLWRAR
jgi:hypothetical protein